VTRSSDSADQTFEPGCQPERQFYLGGGGPFGVVRSVLDAAGRIGTAGVLEAAGDNDSGMA